MDSPSPSGGLPDVSQLVTPILIGVLLDYWLFGILALQIYIHHTSFPSAKITTRLLIWTIFLIELVQASLAAVDVYHWFGAGFGNFSVLNDAHFSPFDTPLLGSLVAFIVQLFFCYRIWSMRKSDLYIVVCAVVITLTAIQLAGGVLAGVDAHVNNYLPTAPVGVPSRVYAYLWLIGGAIADLIIAITLTHLILYPKVIKKPSDTFSFAKRPGYVYQFLSLLLQSNALTACIVVVTLILLNSFPDTNYFITPATILGKLYSNSLMATFNSQLYSAPSRTDTSQHFSAASGRTTISSPMFSSRPPPTSTGGSGSYSLVPLEEGRI